MAPVRHTGEAGKVDRAHLSRNPASVPRHIKEINGPDPTLAKAQRIPKGMFILPEGTDNPYPGHNHFTHTH
jgi:hypothetical protein